MWFPLSKKNIVLCSLDFKFFSMCTKFHVFYAKIFFGMLARYSMWGGCLARSRKNYILPKIFFCITQNLSVHHIFTRRVVCLNYTDDSPPGPSLFSVILEEVNKFFLTSWKMRENIKKASSFWECFGVAEGEEGGGVKNFLLWKKKKSQ